MNIFKNKFKISASIIIAAILFIIFLGSLYFYCHTDNPDNKWGGLFGSLAAGLFVAIIQFFIAWQDFKQTEKIKELKLIEILYNRTSRENSLE